MAVEQDELLWDFKLQSDRTVDKQQKTVVTDVATPGDSSIREKEYKKLRNTRSIKKKKKKEKTWKGEEIGNGLIWSCDLRTGINPGPALAFLVP